MPDTLALFREFASSKSIELPAELLADDEIHRFPTNGKPRDKAGWYILHLDNLPAGAFGDHRQGLSFYWHAKPDHRLSLDEWRAYRKFLRQVREQKAEEGDAARRRAKGIWDHAELATSGHPYLKRKGIGPHGVKVNSSGHLLIPVRQEKEFLSLLTIAADGEKRFAKGCPVNGGYYAIGTKENFASTPIIYIAEGFATAASIYEATKALTVCAFFADNLAKVAQSFRDRFPAVPIVLCADDDWKNEVNTGIVKALDAATAITGLIALPDFGSNRDDKATDFNDLAQAAGVDAVRASLEAASTPEEYIQRHREYGPDDAEDALRVTEDTVARLFERRYGEELRYCKAWGRWFQWTGVQWKTERTLLAFDYARILSRQLNVTGAATPAKASFTKGVEFLASASRTFATEGSQWDSDTWLLNGPAGTIDLRSSETRPHVQIDYITKATRVSPIDGPHPVFDMFMKDITLGDMALVEYHQRSLGACLSGALSDNFLLFWYGTGQNGKNTLGELMIWMLGDYAADVPTATLMSHGPMQQHPTILANLRGLRLAVSSEVSQGSYWDESQVKSLTGDAQISARFMRQDFFVFQRTHKHLVYGNHRPMLRVVDPAMQARLHIVPFKLFVPREARDDTLPPRLRMEAPQIMNWLVEGHERWMEDGQVLKKCSAVQAETDSYFSAQPTNEDWIAECCHEDSRAQTPSNELYLSFKQWKELRGEGVLSQTRWSEWLSTRFEQRREKGRLFFIGLAVKPLASRAYQRTEE